jgi:hypothetical protein
LTTEESGFASVRVGTALASSWRTLKTGCADNRDNSRGRHLDERSGSKLVSCTSFRAGLRAIEILNAFQAVSATQYGDGADFVLTVDPQLKLG